MSEIHAIGVTGNGWSLPPWPRVKASERVVESAISRGDTVQFSTPNTSHYRMFFTCTSSSKAGPARDSDRGGDRAAN